MITPPTADEQVKFLVNLQRLLDEGAFVASYKFALLLALADLAVEEGDDSGAPVQISTIRLTDKFVSYYWRQAIPYPGSTEADVLRQNTGKQAAILNLVCHFRSKHGDLLTRSTRSTREWKRLLSKVARLIEMMPLWKLQTLGSSRLDFLYENTGSGHWIELRRGVAFCFRRFHALILNLVQGAWTQYVRAQNPAILGEVTDLSQFLFGSDRNDLSSIRPVLLDVQDGRCFYCERPLPKPAIHVDHFIPWAHCSVDLAHNFVLADHRLPTAVKDEHRGPKTSRRRRWPRRPTPKGGSSAAMGHPSESRRSSGGPCASSPVVRIHIVLIHEFLPIFYMVAL